MSLPLHVGLEVVQANFATKRSKTRLRFGLGTSGVGTGVLDWSVEN